MLIPRAVVDFTKAYDFGIGLLVYAGNVSALLSAFGIDVTVPPDNKYLNAGVNSATKTINFFCAPCVASLAGCGCAFDGGSVSGLVSSIYGDVSYLVNFTDVTLGPLSVITFAGISFQNAGLPSGTGGGLYALSAPSRPMTVLTKSCVFKNNVAAVGSAVNIYGYVSTCKVNKLLKIDISSVCRSVHYTALETVFEGNSGMGSIPGGTSGNAIVIYGAVMTIDHCVFINNTTPGVRAAHPAFSFTPGRPISPAAQFSWGSYTPLCRVCLLSRVSPQQYSTRCFSRIELRCVTALRRGVSLRQRMSEMAASFRMEALFTSMIHVLFFLSATRFWKTRRCVVRTCSSKASPVFRRASWRCSRWCHRATCCRCKT